MVASIVHVDHARGEVIVQHGGLPKLAVQSLTGLHACDSIAEGRLATQSRGGGNSGFLGSVPHNHES